MPEDPTPPAHRAPRGRAHGSKGHFDWRHPKSWTKNQRWGTGISAAALVLVVLLVVLLVSAGSSPKKAAAQKPSATTAPTASTISHKDPKHGPPVCPLTGTTAPGGKVPARPALAFKVDNYPNARPWSGIDKADIVFEEPVEGFITRLVAVFQCQQAPLVGPIRSARYVDQGITGLLSDPILIHVGDIDQVAKSSTTCRAARRPTTLTPRPLEGGASFQRTRPRLLRSSSTRPLFRRENPTQLWRSTSPARLTKHGRTRAPRTPTH